MLRKLWDFVKAYYITLIIITSFLFAGIALGSANRAAQNAKAAADAVKVEDIKLGKLGCDAVNDTKKVLHDILTSGSGTLPPPPPDLPPSLLRYIGEISAAGQKVQAADLAIVTRPSPLCEFTATQTGSK